MSDHIYLIPGFFGFANLGRMRYFGPVVEHLAQVAPDAVVHTVPTHPTASLTVRAKRLHDTIEGTCAPSDRVHLVGHSSGGLDARLLSTPGVRFEGLLEPEYVTHRIRSVVTVATPNHGTPSAEFFATVAGKRLLRLLSLTTLLVLRRGTVPLTVFVTLADVVRRGTDKVLASEPAMVDEVFEKLLNELSEARRSEVRDFFAEVGSDQGLLLQLSADALEAFNTSTGDRPGVRYGSVMTRARRPDLSSAWQQGLNPTAQSAHAVFALMHRLAGRLEKDPVLEPAQREALAAAWPDGVDRSDSDGMVPTASQPWGRVVRCVDADHLDVLGHYGDPTTEPVRYDWFTTGTGFDRPKFEATWTDVAHFCLD